MPAVGSSVGDLDQLQAAAAKVADDAVRVGDPRDHAFACETASSSALSTSQSKPDSLDFANELGAVGRIPNGGGRDHLRAA